MRHLLRDDDLSPVELKEVLALAADMKASPYDHKPLAGPRSVAMIFDKPTLRTQSSFAAGIAELGGFPMPIDGGLAAVGEREPIADVARVLGRQADAIVWRTFEQARIEEMAEYAGVPVINALTDDFHPCQLLADLLTIQEHKGQLSGLNVTFLGDAASNMGNSWALAGAAAGMNVTFGCPRSFEPADAVLDRVGTFGVGSARVTDAAVPAVEGADVVVADTWISMGKEDEAADRRAQLEPYALTADLLAHADPAAIVLHCLPAYRGSEISAEVLDGPQSVIWDEAENRRHAQKAVLTWLLERQGTP